MPNSNTEAISRWLQSLKTHGMDPSRCTFKLSVERSGTELLRATNGPQ